MKKQFSNYLTYSLCALLFLTTCSDSEDGMVDQEKDPPIGVDTSLNKKPVGESASDLLSNTTFNTLVVELMYIDGQQPTNTAVNNFKSFLENRLHKTTITINQRNIGTALKDVYTINDIQTIEDTNRETYTTDSQIAVSGIFLNGEYSENTSEGKVLGVAYRNTSFVIFEETIKDFSTGVLAPSQSTLESVVINHEFGHILGLVNVGSPMQTNHQDVAHGKHCDDDTCLMFWTAETGEGLINMLAGGSVPELDTNCLADLSANGGK